MDKLITHRTKHYLFLLTLTGALITWTYAYANNSESESAAQVEADELTATNKGKQVSAKGNVIITYEDRTLRAEEVTYNREQNVITADKNIRLEDEHGNTYFADSAEMNDQLTQGIIHNIGGTFKDNSRFAANKGIRESADVTIMEQMVYSPCKICVDRMKGKPLWQITAQKVTLDEIEERVTYNHATLDVYGVPVLYTPYFSHSTPGAGRKSGLLTPSYNSISTLGVTVHTPYYFNIAPNLDATITPIFTSEEGTVLAGELRHLTSRGKYEISGSITNPKERDEFGDRVGGRDLRGHIEGKGHFALENDWSWGFDAKRSTDDTYLQRYKFGNEDLLTSRIYAENISGRNYFGAHGISFQGLNVEDDPDTTPLVLPLINAHYEMPAGYRDARWTFDGNGLVLSRNEGVESRRLSATGGWTLPHITPSGHIFEAKATVRGDIYSVENVIANGQEKDGFIGRAIPEAQVSWNYPLAGYVDASRVLIEPIVNLIASPNGGNPNKIPNEDSQELELSDVNLFSNNHFTGLDRVEGGVRTNFGVRGGVSNPIGNIDFLFGQSYRAKRDENFTPESGLDDNFSDYVGRVAATDNKRANVAYRFRMDKDDLVMRRNEIDANFHFKPFIFNIGYILIDEDTETFDRNEIQAATAFPITDAWSVQVNGHRDLSEIGGWISTGAGLVYEDECLRLATGWNREFTRDRDIEPSTSYTLKISFKNLGST